MFRWKLPAEAFDPDAIMRMRQHFPKPTALMPVAWFMGEIHFYESLQESPQTLDATELCRALKDIAGGIRSFPEVEYVPVWKAWFKYLLPDIILRSQESENFNSYDRWLIVEAITAFFNIYPYEIDEEYPDFRDDVVSTLGNCVMPRTPARQHAIQRGDYKPLFNDIWGVKENIELYGFQSFTEVNASILFCLKYLTTTELNDWANSLFQIDSLQWHLQLIFTLTEWFDTIRLARNWNYEDRDFLKHIVNTTGLLDEFSIPAFKSFDEFIVPENVSLFNEIVSEQFTYTLFRDWTNEILEHLNKSSLSYLNQSLQDELQTSEEILFLRRNAE